MFTTIEDSQQTLSEVLDGDTLERVLASLLAGFSLTPVPDAEDLAAQRFDRAIAVFQQT